ncbi:hypothetical protein [Roseivirga sp.]|uniref:hypothetical protein n=1 Tax=Roseivirga sp. TaxID=1964215 RepID=UPI002B265372|nr:hypothetical protein [Roseivirga sp.]
MKRNGKQIAFEFISIVVAVVLAMALSEWRQDFLNKKQADLSFQNIISEVENNIESIQSNKNEIQKNYDRTTAWLKAGESQRDTTDVNLNFDLGLLSATAMEVAKLNQSLTYLSNDKVMDISGVYSIQEFYQSNGSVAFHKMTDIFLQIRDEKKDKALSLRAYRYELTLALSAILALEGSYKSFLEKYSPNSSALESLLHH